MISPLQILQAPYNSMDIIVSREVSWNAVNEESPIEVHQRLTSVLPGVKDYGRHVTPESPVPKFRQNWSLGQAFNLNRIAIAGCSLARRSMIHTEVDSVGNGREVVSYDVHGNKDELDLRKQWTSILGLSLLDKFLDHNDNISRKHSWNTLLEVDRYLDGYGQVQGKYLVTMNNKDLKAVEVEYVDVIPWFIQLYFHTMDSNTIFGDGRISMMEIAPAENHGHPASLKLRTKLAPNSTFALMIDYDTAFLQFEEHPPDGSRGFDVTAAKYRITSGTQEDEIFSYTQSALVPLPLPDFSMPYNVITLSSTVIVFFVGTMLNTLLRRDDRKKPGQKLIDIIRRFFKRSENTSTKTKED